MRLHFLRSLIVTLVVLAVALLQAEEPKCHAPARECEQQIRRMMSGRRYLGINVVELKPGLVIKNVLAGSPAVRADLKAGDRLMAINGRPLGEAKVSEFKKALAEASKTGRVFLIVMRRGAYKAIETRLEPWPKEYIDKVIAGHLQESHTATAGGEP